MAPVPLTQIQVANLNMLMLIVEATRHDTPSACSRFGLDADQAAFLAALATQDILSLVVHVGDECLFPPRADLVQVLSWPPPLAAVMLMVHPATPRRPASHPDLQPATPPASDQKK